LDVENPKSTENNQKALKSLKAPKTTKNTGKS